MNVYRNRRGLYMFLLASILAGCATAPATRVATPALTPTLAAAPDPGVLVGLWAGGYDVPGTASVGLIEVEFTANGGKLSGKVRQYLEISGSRVGPVLAKVTDVTLDGESAMIAISNGGKEVVLKGALPTAGRISGTATSGGQAGTFELTRSAPLADATLAAWEGEFIEGSNAYGLYRVQAGFSTSKTGQFWLVDLNKGQWRMVVPTSDTTALIGAAFGVAFPSDGNLTFVKDSGGRLNTLNVERGGATVSLPRVNFRTEELTFKSGELKLAGLITFPMGPGPYPAVVIVHGSEPGTRYDPRLLTRLLAMRGIAALSYDKRGVGDSEGVYFEDASDENIMNLAGDAASAVAALKARTDINSKQIGMWGGSQAGWVIPAAAAQSPDVAFIMLTSGPVVSTGEEGTWSSYTSNGGTPAAQSLQELETQIDSTEPLGFDSQPYIMRLKIPGLWVFGAQDRSMPAAKSGRNLANIKQQTGGDFTRVTLPDADHLLLASPDGMTASLPFSDGYAPGYIDTLFNWLLPRVTVVGP